MLQMGDKILFFLTENIFQKTEIRGKLIYLVVWAILYCCPYGFRVVRRQTLGFGLIHLQIKTCFRKSSYVESQTILVERNT